MPLDEITRLETTLSSFKAIIESHAAARQRLIDRRVKAEQEEIDRLDEMISINGRTMEALKRAEETLQSQLHNLRTTVYRPR